MAKGIKLVQAKGSRAADMEQLPKVLRNLANPTTWWLDEEPPLPVYVIDPYLQLGETAVIAGANSVGKSYFSIPAFIAIGTGGDFFGLAVPQKRRAMYVMLERSKHSLHRRLRKVAHALMPGDEKRKQFRRDLEKNCRVYPLAGEDIYLVEQVGGQWEPKYELIDALITAMKAAGIEVLFLDPMRALHGAPENDNAAMSAFTKALERIVQATGCSIVLIHHSGKNGTGDQYGFRGASAIGDNTSEMIILSKVEGDERKRLALSALSIEERHNDIVKVHHARCSDGRPAPDLYLVRSDNGVLLRRDLTGGVVGDDQRVAIAAWARDREFTMREFRDARGTWGIRIAKQEAERIFTELITTEYLRYTGETRKGGKLATLQCGPGHSRATRATHVKNSDLDRKKRPGHSKSHGGTND